LAATAVSWRICPHWTTSLPGSAPWARSLGRLTKPREIEGRSVKGLNFFAPDEQALLHAIQDPKGNIAGFRRGDLLAELAMFSPTRLSRQLRRLLDIGVIKRATGTYRYSI
jgi:hypothetical protein